MIHVGGARPVPTGLNKIKPLGKLIGVYKTITAKQINQPRDSPGFSIWQRNYYEHIFRSQEELDNISGYILANPNKGAVDL
jgi:putative transposase